MNKYNIGDKVFYTEGCPKIAGVPGKIIRELVISCVYMDGKDVRYSRDNESIREDRLFTSREDAANHLIKRIEEELLSST